MERLTRPRSTSVTNFFIVAPSDVAGEKQSRYAALPDKEVGSRQRCCRGDSGGKGRKKNKKREKTHSEGGGREEGADWPLEEEKGKEEEGSLASGSELLMEGGSQS